MAILDVLGLTVANPFQILSLPKVRSPILGRHWAKKLHPQLPHHTTSPVMTKITTKATVATTPLILASDIGRFMGSP